MPSGVSELPADYRLPAPWRDRVLDALQQWGEQDRVRRLWERDPSLWTGADEAEWLGWLDLASDQRARSDELSALADEVRGGSFRYLLLLGMGGSSLCPEVLARSFGPQAGYPELRVLDSTDPAMVRRVEREIDLDSCLVIVSSKSGTTTETNLFRQYFYELISAQSGLTRAGARFIAITDPGSALEAAARRDGFAHLFHGIPSIGGRYSALSNFGLVPAAAIGLDPRHLLGRAAAMAQRCGPQARPDQNPGLILGLILGQLGRAGRNKVTFISSPGIEGLGGWLEQLLAESTGKQGQGLIPVDREPLGGPEVYGDDRLFVHLHLEADAGSAVEPALAALERAGQPVVRIALGDRYDLGTEFFRWEFATAVAGSVLEIHPFDQPDVEASKQATRKLTAEYERSGALPTQTALFEDPDCQVFAAPAVAAALRSAAERGEGLRALLRAFMETVQPGDYAALLAYLDSNAAHDQELQRMRLAIRTHKQIATCVGFGPRFLHSTGQAYKGGPNSGVFLQITCADAEDVPIPGQPYGFSLVKAAQARGDFEVMEQRRRRAIRVHLKRNPTAALVRLRQALEATLQS
ncbi:MAG TPA: bifunctional transaldolase/phosoglucose isomerase [Acidobacteriota bacterium]